MSLFTNLGLLSTGAVIPAIGMLGFVVFFSNPKSSTNKTFLLFCILTIIWGSLNFLSYRITSPEIAFWLLRLSIFTAVWHVVVLYALLRIFPSEKFKFPKSFELVILPLASISALLNLTPLTFKHIEKISSEGRVVEIANGPGIILFSLVILTLIIGSITDFIVRLRKHESMTPQQAKPVVYGIVTTFTLILVFNFVFPAFLNNSNLIAFGGFYVFPLIIGFAYSIYKHKLLDIKVVSTQIFTFLLAIVLLLQAVMATDIARMIFQIFIFLSFVTIGILLIRSVMREVKQRELLQALSTQLSDANEKLKALDVARSEFITIASHQLRTPPATIKWYLGAMLAGDYGKVPKTLKEILEKTTRTNNSLISLIDDMLNVSRIERGKMEFLFEEIEVLPLAELTIEQLIPMSKEKKLELTLEKPKKPLPKIMADKEKLRQVMNNLIDNALKYTKQGGVTIKLFQLGDDIRFEVHDTGKGFSKEEGGQIFEKFKRGKESARHSAGLGLGLYVAKVIVEQHKGKIWAESEGEGKGSVFMFSLPIHTELKETTLLDLTKA